MDKRPPKDRNLFQKNAYDVARFRMLYDNKTPEQLQADRSMKKWEKASQQEQDEKEPTAEDSLKRFVLNFVVYGFAIIMLVWIISVAVGGSS
jgi:Flp pilus assembly protein TadB